MGQKVSPIGFRVGVNKPWDSQWVVADKNDFKTFIKEDYLIRKMLKDKYLDSAIGKIIIDRASERTNITITTGRPGVLIGIKGAGIEKLKKELSKISSYPVNINIQEIRNPDVDAQLVAESIASQIEKRISYKRAMKMAIQKAMKSGAKGIKAMAGGRLDGAEIARSEFYKEGSLPLHTIRSNVSYGTTTARTQAGAIGIKVWIYFGEVLGKINLTEAVAKQGGNSNVNA